MLRRSAKQRAQVLLATQEHAHALAEHHAERSLERRTSPHEIRELRLRGHTPWTFSRCAAILFARSSAAGRNAGANIAFTSGPDGPPASIRKMNTSSLDASAREGARRFTPLPFTSLKKKRKI